MLGQGWGVVAAESLEEGNNPDGEQDMRVALGILERAGLIERHPDAPRTIDVALRRADIPGDDRWERFIAATGLQPGDQEQIDAVAVARALDISPAELEGQLLGWAEEEGALAVRVGRRELCLRLVLPPPPDAAATLPRLLDDLRRENEARVARMIAYATGLKCRHATLAAHLGERLAPCETACDVCVNGRTGERANGRASNGQRAGRPAVSAPRGRRPPLGRRGRADRAQLPANHALPGGQAGANAGPGRVDHRVDQGRPHAALRRTRCAGRRARSTHCSTA